MALRGAKKRTAQHMAVSLASCPVVLPGWAILGRRQSEILPLELGLPADATDIHVGRHSGVFWDCAGAMWVKLPKRKRRTLGGWLSAVCTCASQGRTQCTPCRVKDYVEAHGILPR